MNHIRRHFLIGGSALFAASCTKLGGVVRSSMRPAARIETFDNRMLDIIDPAQSLDVLSSGYGWSEGPVWDKARGQLYFTDVPGNTAYVWSSGTGTEVFLEPSGASVGHGEGFREPGANGLLMGQDGRLLICNHGKRVVEAMDITTGDRVTLVESYDGKAFNSPNDLIQASNGDIFFTDPPYGLEGLNESPLKEMPVNGVYKLAPDGNVVRLLDDMTFPNGIALSQDEAWLYVSQSDPDAPLIRRISLKGTFTDEAWFDAAPYIADGPGLPDGLAVTTNGLVFATGPGGVFVLTQEGEALGRINLGRASANCTFGEDGQSLFIAAHDRLMRVRTKVKGLGWD